MAVIGYGTVINNAFVLIFNVILTIWQQLVALSRDCCN